MLKPLDLEDIPEWLEKQLEKRNDLIKFEKINPSNPPLLKEIVYITRIRDVLVSEILQRIRKACEFYLWYKDKPSILWNERINYIKKIKKDKELWKFIEKLNKERCITLRLYNEWLFKLAFRGVFGEKNG